MPCMGPSKDFAYKQGEKVFEEVLTMLKDKYNIDLSDNRIKCQNKMALGKVMAGNLTEAREGLKLAIQEVVWNDDCANF